MAPAISDLRSWHGRIFDLSADPGDTAPQNDLIWVTFLVIAEEPPTAHNGGSARGYQPGFA
jgi:hypothetical protein